MSRRRAGLTYEMALRILGRHDSNLLRVADTITSLLGLGAFAASAGILDVFGAKDAAISLAQDALRRVGPQARGLSRMDRTALLEAANGVLVLAALQESVGTAVRRATNQKRHSVVSVVDHTGQDLATMRAHELVRSLTDVALPAPDAATPRATLLEELRGFYDTSIGQLVRVLKEIDPFEAANLAESKGDRIGDATQRYLASARTLSAAVPEFALWWSSSDVPTTQSLIVSTGTRLEHELSTLSEGLAQVVDLLTRMSSSLDVSEERRNELATTYRARLDRPILAGGWDESEPDLPNLGQLYVTLDCEVTTSGASWRSATVETDIHRFLLAHLTTSAATDKLVLVNGLPGSGKSTVSSVLAATLPPADYLVLLVKLRDVPSDASVPEQLASALRDVIGRGHDWADLVRSAPGTMPVVVLDGLDEMLLASGRPRSDYLEEVREFQARERDAGRPVALVVTSRPTYQYRVRVPAGSAIVTLKPLTDVQVSRWVDAWNECTAPSGADPKSPALDARIVLRHQELAEQPLLLLLLALHELQTSRLATLPEDATTADLYEGVFHDYARREIRRTNPRLSLDQEGLAVERLLLGLGFVALSFVNRRSIVISDADLADDIQALDDADAVGLGNLNWIDLLEHFYFVHISRSKVGVGENTRAFEFLHATFGDFLAARFVFSALRNYVDDRKRSTQRMLSREPDSGELFASLSFQTLTDFGWLLGVLVELLRDLPSEQLADYVETLQTLRETALGPQPGWRTFDRYRPTDATVVARLAVFTANITLLQLELSPSGIEFDSRIGVWGMTRLWESQIGSRSLDTLERHMRLRIRSRYEVQDNGLTFDLIQTLVLSKRDDSITVKASETVPTFVNVVDEESKSVFGPIALYDFEVHSDSLPGRILESSALSGSAGPWLDALVPVWRYGDDSNRNWPTDGERFCPPQRPLLEVVLGPVANSPDPARIWAYDCCFTIDWNDRVHITNVVLRRLVVDVPGLGDSAVADLLVCHVPRFGNLDVAESILQVVDAASDSRSLALRLADALEVDAVVSDSSGVLVESPESRPIDVMSSRARELFELLQSRING